MSYTRVYPLATADFHTERTRPFRNGYGQKVYKCIAMAKTTAKYVGEICYTDSGMCFTPQGSYALATCVMRPGVSLGYAHDLTQERVRLVVYL